MYEAEAPERRLKPAIVLKYSTPLVFAEDLLDLLADRVGALERRGVGQLDVDEEVALVLVGHEAAGQPLAEQPGERR